jgi:hypothetical protein
MLAQADEAQFEKTKAEQLIAETPLAEGIDSISVELGEDHDGDPSMWLVFRLRDISGEDWEAVRRLNDFAAVLQTKILHSGLTRFPYTRWEQAA